MRSIYRSTLILLILSILLIMCGGILRLAEYRILHVRTDWSDQNRHMYAREFAPLQRTAENEALRLYRKVTGLTGFSVPMKTVYLELIRYAVESPDSAEIKEFIRTYHKGNYSFFDALRDYDLDAGRAYNATYAFEAMGWSVSEPLSYAETLQAMEWADISERGTRYSIPALQWNIQQHGINRKLDSEKRATAEKVWNIFGALGLLPYEGGW